MRGFQPAKAKAKAQPFANGGQVRGPGTGTSDDIKTAVPDGTYIMPADSTAAVGEQALAKAGARGFTPGGNEKVPVNLSNGEFNLPPEQVHALGVQALDQIKNATHTPAARGFSPGKYPVEDQRFFFADGGEVKKKEDDKPINQSNFFPGNSPDAGANIYAGVGPANGLGSSGQFAKVPDGIGDQPGRQPTKPNSFGDAAAAASNPGVTQVAQPKAAPVAPIAPPVAPPVTPPASTPLAAQQATPSPVTMQPQQAPAKAAPQQTGTSPSNIYPQASPSAGKGIYAGVGFNADAPKPGAQPAGFSYMDNNQSVGQEIKDAWSKGNYGEAAGKAVAGTVSMFTTPLIDGATKAGAAAWDGAAGFGRGVFGMDAQASPAVAGKPLPASSAGAGRGAVNPAVAEPARPQEQSGPGAAAPASADAKEQVMPGVYQHGRGQYSDQASGMGFPSGFTGQPNAQNMAAADVMDKRLRQESMARVMASQQATPAQSAGMSVSAPIVRHSGNDWQARKDLENAKTAASSIYGSSQWAPKGYSEGRQARYNAAMAHDNAMKAGEPAQQAGAMRENAALQREGMQQQGATSRAQMQETGLNSRFGQTQDLAQQKFGMEREEQGFKTRAATQSEQLRNTLLDPKATPEQRSIAQRNLAALSGKTAADRMQTVALPDTTTDTGQVVRGGQALVRTLEDGTVVQVPVGAAQQGGAQPLPPGMKRQVGTSNGRPVYEDMNGKQVIAKG